MNPARVQRNGVEIVEFGRCYFETGQRGFDLHLREFVIFSHFYHVYREGLRLMFVFRDKPGAVAMSPWAAEERIQPTSR